MSKNFFKPCEHEFLINVIETVRIFYEATSEVIPRYNEKEIQEVLDCVNRCCNTYYREHEEIISALLFNLNKGHYLPNGNKRITFFICVAYMSDNNLFPSDLSYLTELNRINIKIAQGLLEEKDIIKSVKKMLNDYI